MRIANLLIWLAFGLLWASGPAQADAVRQVFLVQNSGWMEPFLTAKESQFRPLIQALAGAARAVDGPVTVAAFNQDGQVAGRSSPQILYEGPYDAGRIASAVTAIDLPFKKGTRSYSDADFNGALLGAIRGPLQGREGVIWMITNNKNAPGNSQEVQRNTAAFYASLRGAEAITRIIAYPVRMPLRGQNFSEGGFVVYGIGYGPGGGRALDVILAASPIRSLFSFPPIGLKPVLGAPVKLRFEDIDTKGLRAGIENGVLVVRGANAANGATFRLSGRLHNGFYPQRIASAQVDLAWAEINAGGGLIATNLAQAAVTPARVENLAPQSDSGPLTVTLTVPPVMRPSGLSGLFADDRTIDGTLSIRLRDMALDLDPAFLDRIRPIFGGTLFAEGQARTVEGQLPDLFLDFRKVSETATTLPVRIEVAFSPWPLIGAGLGGLALLGALGAGAAALNRARSQVVMLGSFAKQVTLKPYRAQILRAPDGTRWRVRRGLFGPPQATRLAEPATRA